jgi:hypothetical protein
MLASVDDKSEGWTTLKMMVIGKGDEKRPE